MENAVRQNVGAFRIIGRGLGRVCIPPWSKKLCRLWVLVLLLPSIPQAQVLKDTRAFVPPEERKNLVVSGTIGSAPSSRFVLTLTASIVAPTCEGAQNGSLDLQILGGTPPYHVLWTGPSGFSATTEDLSGIASGNYLAQVTDSNGLQAVQVFQLLAPVAVSANLDCCSDDAISCGDSAILMVHFQGQGPWLFSWTDGSLSYSTTTSQNPYPMVVRPRATTTYALTGVSGAVSGCTGNVCGQATIGVNHSCLGEGTRTLDFEHDGAGKVIHRGTVVSNQWSVDGLHFSFVNLGGGPHIGMIFDSDSISGGDVDLGTPNQAFGGPGIGGGGALNGAGPNPHALGNLLIVSEDGSSQDPDDEAGGGIMVMDFAQPSRVDSLVLLDVDDPHKPSKLVYIDSTGAPADLYMPNHGDNGLVRQAVGLDDVTRLELHLGGSGALAEIQYEPICDDLCFDARMSRIRPIGTCVQITVELTCRPGCRSAGLEHLDISVPCGRVTALSNSLGLKSAQISMDPTTGISGVRLFEIPACDSSTGTFFISYQVCPDGNQNSCSPAFCTPMVAYYNSTCTLYERIQVKGQKRDVEDQVAEAVSSMESELTAWPNPFSGQVKFQLPEGQSKPVEIYDLSGRRLVVIPVGDHEKEVVWDGRDQVGNPVSRGLYLARMGSDDQNNWLKLIKH